MSDEGSLVLGSKKFQELTGRNRSEDLARSMAKAATDPQTGLLSKKHSEERNCPICGSNWKNSRVMFVKLGFHYRCCKKCGVTYVSPMLCSNELLVL